MKGDGKGLFQFKYGTRVFEFKAATNAEADVWVSSLRVLVKLAVDKTVSYASPSRDLTEYEHVGKMTEGKFHERLRSGTIARGSSIVGGEEGEDELFDGLEQKGKKIKKVKKKFDGHKFENINIDTYKNVLKQAPDIIINKDQQQLSE